MKFKEIFIKEVTVDEKFNYKALYNDDRGAVFKDEYKSLIKEAISKNELTLEKFIIGENVQDELFDISNTRGFEYSLINGLKNYHNESTYAVAPFIYILKKLDPNLTMEINENKLKIVSILFEVEICPRIDGKNAESRLFFPKEKIAFASINDDIETLVGILSVKDVEIYIVGTDDRSNVIYAYKINRSNIFLEIAQNYETKLRLELFRK